MTKEEKRKYSREYYLNNTDKFKTYYSKNKEHAKRYAKDVYSKTKRGVLVRIYNSQKLSSKRRGHPMPKYTGDEFRERYIDNTAFVSLYNKWVTGGYVTLEKPSFDRIDCTKPYTFGNLQIMTWKENNDKGRIENAGRANVGSKKVPVIQYTIEGVEVARYESVTKASEIVTGAHRQSITKCCIGNGKTAGGYIWKYSEALNGK